ncbi:33561_t:CDS:2 [Racocetra persica]|uniref:33561_t:CDS:1 n=1 Tax=Racocetra persica TaxID=160502 RepID=A0ACA9QE10_9GLOM|nr:33561_t:CDS:2 [Racocetra persica]
MSSVDFSELRYPDYWTRDFNTWGINDWDTYWIEKQPQSLSITKHNSHTALADELRCLKKIYTSTHPAYNKIQKLLKYLRNSTMDATNKKIWETRDQITSLKMESELIELERGFQVYADTEFDSVEQERKRIRANENYEVAVKKAFPIITSLSNTRDHTQNEQSRQQTLGNQGEPSSGMVLRKKEKVKYAESSNSSDSDGYVEYKNARSKRYARVKSVSREITPVPTTYSIKHTLLATPNKPIITKSTYHQYSAHIICAFNTTIHLVKETLEEQAYEKVKNMLQMGNKLVIKDSIVENLEKIFQTEYSEIESKIISETKIGDNQATEEDRFIFFIRYALLDFVSMFKYLTPKVLDRNMLERSYIVECLSPILRAFRNAFPDIKYMWIEKDVRSIKDANDMFMSNIGERKTDLLILRLSDARELLNVEVSGPPYRSTKKHSVGDVKKLLMMAICNLCRLLGNNLDCNIEDAKNVKTYSIQVIGDRLTLFTVSLADKKKYLAVELASCIIPFTFDAISCYKKIFNFFAVIRNEFVEQEKLQKKIRSFIPADNCTENLREWLHLPDDDISLVTEEDIDEIFMI